MPSEPPPPRKEKAGVWVTRWRSDPDPHTHQRHHHKKRFYGDQRSAMRQYRRWLKRWKVDEDLQNPRQANQVSVEQVAEKYLEHANRTHRKDGQVTSRVYNIRSALERLTSYYGDVSADQLTAPALARFRDDLDQTQAVKRPTINEWLTIVRQAWDWAAEQGYIEPDVALRLTRVRRLQRGRSASNEYRDITPVAWATVEPTLAHCSDVVAAMIRLQWHTGMRPDEVCSLRTGDLDTSGEVWLYYPLSHKTDHHGKTRIVAIGPEAKKVLKPWLSNKLNACVFRPNRVPKADRDAGPHYTTDSYRRAIHRACDRAFPPPKRLQRQYVEANGRKKWRLQTEAEWRAALGEKAWAELEQWREDHRWSPNQLRHAKATELRKRYGLEVARLALGHSSADMTAVYAERDLERLVEIAKESG